MAQGMLCAFDSLYININANRKSLKGTDATGPGVYRLTDTDGDDQYDKVEYIVPMSDQAGEHGPHALVLSPDGKRIYFCSGNQTDVPESATGGAVPRHWGEDHLLGRMPDGRGFMQDRLAPGGWICSMNPDGSNVKLWPPAFATNTTSLSILQGDLFAYDADMEWDIGTPWYRPTRVNHVISGAEFGWRNGTGKWPDYYGDSFGAVVNIGPGSPTGIAFGTGAKFPAKYQQSLFISDWSYGVIYAVHMQADGATTRRFRILRDRGPDGGDRYRDPSRRQYVLCRRRTQDFLVLYRVRYTGSESTSPAAIRTHRKRWPPASCGRRWKPFTAMPTRQQLRQRLPTWEPRSGLRFAARIALEFQPVE